MDKLLWYVAETLPQSEKLSQANLLRQGFECFVPRLRKIRRHARRSEVVHAPVFPGYIFVQFNRERDPWRSINGTYGVKRLVGPHSAKPQPIPEAIIEALRSRCDPDTFLLNQSDFAAGDQVRFLDGPFADRIARVEELNADGRVSLLLEILGAARRIIAKPDALIPA